MADVEAALEELAGQVVEERGLLGGLPARMSSRGSMIPAPSRYPQSRLT